MNMKAPLP